jgi:hypothetical protein
MTTRPLRPALIFALMLLPIGCGRSGPSSVRTTSTPFPTLQAKVAFVHRYVAFRRTYETLDFDLFYQNNDGVPPGPSDWDVRLVATVPASEIAAWIPAGLTPSPQDQQWLKTIPTSLDLSGLTEWYGDDRVVVGIDRDHRIVAYRNWAD